MNEPGKVDRIDGVATIIKLVNEVAMEFKEGLITEEERDERMESIRSLSSDEYKKQAMVVETKRLEEARSIDIIEGKCNLYKPGFIGCYYWYANGERCSFYLTCTGWHGKVDDPVLFYLMKEELVNFRKIELERLESGMEKYTLHCPSCGATARSTLHPLGSPSRFGISYKPHGKEGIDDVERETGWKHVPSVHGLGFYLCPSCWEKATGWIDELLQTNLVTMDTSILDLATGRGNQDGRKNIASKRRNG